MPCEICNMRFSFGDPVYVVNNDGEFDFSKIAGVSDNHEQMLLCPECWGRTCDENGLFKDWWEKNTAILNVPQDELDAAEMAELDYCSYFTTYNEEQD